MSVSKQRFLKSIAASATYALSTICFSLSAPAALAAEFDQLSILSQAQFKTLSENLGAATHYRAVAPAEPMGLLGFDIAAELTSTQIDEEPLNAASGGDFDPGSILLPRVHIHKGLPFGLDVGASLGAIPGTDFRVMGGEIRYAILQGSTLTPALAVRGTYSVTSGVDEFEASNAGVELSISKGFALLTPYAGVGIIRTTVTPEIDSGLNEVESDLQKVYVGLNINLGFNIAIEVDQTGDYTSYSAKAGIRF